MLHHKSFPIARTLAEAQSLGHQDTDVRPSAQQIQNGIHFADAAGAAGVVCWVGLCGDPEPGFRQVKYTDENGLCNIYKKERC